MSLLPRAELPAWRNGCRDTGVALRSMLAGSPTRSRLWLGGVAMAGVVLAHVLAYFMAAPHRNGRDMLLRASGHRHWAVVASLALGALVAGLIWFTTQATRPDRVWSLGARAFFVSTARRLVLLQVGGFVLLEASERLLFGAGFGLLAEPVVLIGILLQVVSALGAAGLLVVFARTLDRLCGRSSAARIVASPGPRPRVWILPPRFLLAAGGATLRGPPLRHRSSLGSIPSS